MVITFCIIFIFGFVFLIQIIFRAFLVQDEDEALLDEELEAEEAAMAAEEEAELIRAQVLIPHCSIHHHQWGANTVIESTFL